jgi:sRNA-binding carbon storage regulator CsrA
MLVVVIMSRVDVMSQGVLMLLLVRKSGKAVKIRLAPGANPATPIGEVFSKGPMVIHVLDASNGRVCFGIEADKRLLILREELEE